MHPLPEPRRAWRQPIARFLAPVLALCVLAACMVAPMVLFVVLTDRPWDAEAPAGTIWLVVIGGGIGAGAAHFGFRTVLTRLGRIDPQAADRTGWKR